MDTQHSQAQAVLRDWQSMYFEEASFPHCPKAFKEAERLSSNMKLRMSLIEDVQALALLANDKLGVSDDDASSVATADVAEVLASWGALTERLQAAEIPCNEGVLKSSEVFKTSLNSGSAAC